MQWGGAVLEDNIVQKGHSLLAGIPIMGKGKEREPGIPGGQLTLGILSAK